MRPGHYTFDDMRIWALTAALAQEIYNTLTQDDSISFPKEVGKKIPVELSIGGIEQNFIITNKGRDDDRVDYDIYYVDPT